MEKPGEEIFLPPETLTGSASNPSTSPRRKDDVEEPLDPLGKPIKVR
jgi:hypothetical protein